MNFIFNFLNKLGEWGKILLFALLIIALVMLVKAYMQGHFWANADRIGAYYQETSNLANH